MLFKRSVFSNRTLLPQQKPLTLTSQIETRSKQLLWYNGGQLHITRTGLRLLGEEFGQGASNTILTGPHTVTLHTSAPGGAMSLTPCCGRRGRRGSKGALQAAVPRLLSYLAPRLDVSQAGSLGAAPLFQPELHKGIVLRHWPPFPDWPLFTHSVAGGG